DVGARTVSCHRRRARVVRRLRVVELRDEIVIERGLRRDPIEERIRAVTLAREREGASESQVDERRLPLVIGRGVVTAFVPAAQRRDEARIARLTEPRELPSLRRDETGA